MPTALSERMKKLSGHYTTTSGVSSGRWKQIPVARTLSGSLDKHAAHGSVCAENQGFHLSDQQEEEGEEQDDDDDEEEEEEEEEKQSSSLTQWLAELTTGRPTAKTK